MLLLLIFERDLCTSGSMYAVMQGVSSGTCMCLSDFSLMYTEFQNISSGLKTNENRKPYLNFNYCR